MDLNPYSNASDPLNITSGNPYLEPEQTRNIELSHVFTTAKKASLTSSVYYNFNKTLLSRLRWLIKKEYLIPHPQTLEKTIVWELMSVRF